MTHTEEEEQYEMTDLSDDELSMEDQYNDMTKQSKLETMESQTRPCMKEHEDEVNSYLTKMRRINESNRIPCLQVS